MANRLRAAAAVVGLAVLFPGGAGAQNPVFEIKSKPASVTCADLNAKGVVVEVLNATSDPQSLEPLVVPAKAGDVIASLCGGIDVSGPSGPVAGGETVKVTLKAKAATPAAATVQGLVVVKPAVGDSAVLPITVLAKPETDSPTPLLDTYATTAYRNGDATVIEIPVDLHDMTEIALPTDKPVAFLSADDGHIASVTYDGSNSRNGQSFARFKIPNVSAGKYSGTVDLTPDTDGGDVALTVVVRDPWYVFLAIVFAGIAAAFLSQHLFSVRQPRKTLESKAEAIASGAAPPGGPGTPPLDDWRFSDLGGLDAAVAALKGDIDAATAGAWVSLDDKVVASLQDKIDHLAAKVEKFGTLAEKSTVLEQSLESYRDHAPNSLPSHNDKAIQPHLVLQAHGYLRRHTVQVNDVDSFVDGVDAARVNVLKIAALREAVSVVWSEAQALEHAGVDVSPIEHQITSVWTEAWVARAPDRLAEFASHLAAAQYRLGLLWPLDTDEANVRRREGGTRRVENITADLGAQPAVATRVDGVTILVPAAEAPALKADVDSARQGFLTARRISGAAALVGGVLALLAATTALYHGQPWGSRWDYLVALTWGLATPATLSGIGTLLNGVGGLTVLRRKLG